MVVMLGLGENRAWGFFAQPQPAPGVYESTTQEPIRDFYDASQYDASDYAVAANSAGPLRFSQTTASPFFSAEGSMGGRAISSVADDLRAGVLKPADLPVEYLVRDGNSLLINTRSSLALKQANIPESSWSLINRTGVESAEAAMTERLLRNGLGSGGTDVLRITGAGKGASVLRP